MQLTLLNLTREQQIDVINRTFHESMIDVVAPKEPVMA